LRATFLALALVVGALLPATSAVTADAAPSQPAPSPPPSADPGSLGIRLLDAPTEAANDPRARSYIVDNLAPGTVIRRRVEVSNTTAAPTPVTLYPAAASIGDGAFAPADDRTPNELSTWTTLDPPSPTLAPGARTPVLLTIAVPPDASSGERYAVVWAQQTTPAPTGGGVAQVNRVGIRIYLSVSAGGPPPSGFVVDTLTAQRSNDGRPLVTTQVRNTGGRALDLSGQLTLAAGPGGLAAGPFPAQLGTTLAPGQSSSVAIPLDQQLPDGPWQARLGLRSGLVDQSTQATIRFPSSAGSADPVRAESPSGFPVWVVALIGGIAALSLLGLLIVLIRNWRSRRTGTTTPPSPPTPTSP